MASPPDAREAGPSKRTGLRALLWSLAGVSLAAIGVITALPIVKASASSLSFQWVIFGLLCAAVVGALVVLPIVTRRR